MPGPLAHIRVIDIATPLAEMAGRALADLGAEVIKIEPPGGAAARRIPPFIAGREGDPEASLYWASVALGKKSVVLDLDTPAGRATLLDLARSADVFIESGAPGVMANQGFGHEALAAVNPGLVYASVSPFGQDGPEASSPATDLTIEASSGLLALQGDGDRPPVPVGYPQASFHAGVQAAADICVALYEREQSGLGQWIDVSAQAAMVWTLMNATGYPANTGGNPPGSCEQRAQPPAKFLGVEMPKLLRCADGWVGWAIALPVVGPRTLHELMRWAEAEGVLDDAPAGKDWTNFIAEAVAGQLTPSTLAPAIAAVQRLAARKTKVELQSRAATTGILVSAVYTVADLLTDPQLAAREFWTEVDGRIHPGPVPRLSGTPAELRAPAPTLGQHQDIATSARSSPALHGSGSPRRSAFEGLKVADFAWVGVGPLISKALADHGATVVHLESASRPDILRLLPPFKDAIPGLNRSQFVANFNTSKLGLACDFAVAEGRALAQRVIDWCDVVVESFTPGTMAKFGFDFATQSQARPDLVMLSTCLRGQTGPERGYTGFGGQGASLAAVHGITGWPDRPPAGPWGAYTDFINPRYGVAALASAILHRRRTGQGQYIDLSQSEGGIRFIEPLVLDYVVNGRSAPASGHHSATAAPHGVYRSAGDERYVAIAVEDDAQWQALVSVTAIPFSPDLPAVARRSAGSEIDAALAAWAAPRDAFEAGQALRGSGVPAYPVLRPTDLYADAQLAARGFFVTLDHLEMGPTPYDGFASSFSATPPALRCPGPLLGQDTDRVLTEVLGLSDDEVVALAASGALS
ncbi:MAG: CaiB/BaiF CoA transferase family protein [Dehalococcoidia bacterium]